MHKAHALLSDREKPVKWLFYGDSITHGAVHTFGQRDYTEHFSERVRTELGRAQDIVIKTAISGYTTRDLLAAFDWRVAAFRPDAVFLMIGMNDCCAGRNIALAEFQENLRILVKKIDDFGGLPILQTTCPILPGSAPDREQNFPSFMNAVRELAAKRSLTLIDHEAFWKANVDKHYCWMSTGFHPNGAGHLAFAREIFRKFGIFDENSKTCRLFLP